MIALSLLRVVLASSLSFFYESGGDSIFKDTSIFDGGGLADLFTRFSSFLAQCIKAPPLLLI